MTREQAKEVALKSTKNDMERLGKTLDDVCIMSPRIGKDNWTFREVIDAIEKDANLEDCEDSNPIDSILRYDKYRIERGLPSLVDSFLNKKK